MADHAPGRFGALPRGVLVNPSILAADFADLAADCRSVLDPPGAGPDGRADLLHLDVMDGHFVPNLTMGPALTASLRRAMPEVVLDVHLMVTDPAAYVGPFADAGADALTFHAEAVSDPAEARALADRIRAAGCAAGLAINPDTPAGAIASDPAWSIAEAFDLVLVMGVRPGFAGQAFMPVAVEQVAAVWSAAAGVDTTRANPRISVDGGVGPANAKALIGAGADLLVAASAIFRHPREGRGAAIAAIRAGGGA